MKRFSITAPYDPTLDLLATPEGQRMLAIFNNMPKYKKELATHAMHKANNKKVKEIAVVRQRREDAELRAAETIRLACRAMEHAMVSLEETPAPSRHQKAINVEKVRNCLFELRNKCGIYFEDKSEVTEKKTELDRLHIKEYIPLWERPDKIESED